jgi:hypothetical protein
MTFEPIALPAPRKRHFRVNLCAVCGQYHAPAYDFRRVLKQFGLKGDRAAVECVQRLFARLEQLKGMIQP